MSLLPFQVECIDSCKIYLRDFLGLPDIEFKEIVGKRESYYKLDLEHGSHKFEIYVYTDEAGFMIDGHNWIICERPDYSNDEELINSFIIKLKNAILSFEPSTMGL